MSIIAVKVTAQNHDFFIPTWRVSGNLHNMSAFQMPDASVSVNIIDRNAFELATGLTSSDKQTLVRMMKNLCEELVQYGYYQQSGDVEDRDDAIPYMLQVVTGVYIGVAVDINYEPREDALMFVIGNDAFFYNNHDSVTGNYQLTNDTVFLSDTNHVISAVSLYNSGTHGQIQGYSHCGNLHCDYCHYYASNWNNDLMNSMVNATWVEPPIPERSNLDMFDLSNRFSPRVAQQGIGAYALSKQSIDKFMNDLWDPSNVAYFVIGAGALGSPVDYIMTCRCYHGLEQDVPLSASMSTINLGPYNFGGQWNASGEAHDTFSVCASEFAMHDFGVVDIPTALASRMRGDYLDYAPFVKYQLYLPYVGYIDLNPNDVIDGKIGIQMNVNLITGEGLYVVYTKDNSKHQKVDGTTDSEQVIFTVPCQLGLEIPITPSVMQNLVRSMVNTIGSAVAIGASAGVAGGVAAAGMGANALASQNQATKVGMQNGRISQDQGQAMIAKREAEMTSMQNQATMNQIGGNAIVQGLAQAMPTPDVGRSGGGFNSDTGTLGSFNPFIIVTFPIVATPNGFEDIFGNRCAVIDTLNNCSGFTQIVAVEPSNDDTNVCKYKNEIIALLQAGVYMPTTTPSA